MAPFVQKRLVASVMRLVKYLSSIPMHMDSLPIQMSMDIAQDAHHLQKSPMSCIELLKRQKQQ